MLPLPSRYKRRRQHHDLGDLKGRKRHPKGRRRWTRNPKPAWGPCFPSPNSYVWLEKEHGFFILQSYEDIIMLTYILGDCDILKQMTLHNVMEMGLDPSIGMEIWAPGVEGTKAWVGL